MGLLVFSNIFVALCAVALSLETVLLLGQSTLAPPLSALIFFATLAVYNFDRLAGASREDRVSQSARHRWIWRHRRPLWSVTGVACVGVVGCAAMLPWRVLIPLIPLGLVSAAYSIRLVRGRRLKELPGAKTFLVALVWAVVTVGLPVIYLMPSSWWFDASTLWLHAERASFVFAITLPFEVRDMSRDRSACVTTLPHLLGVRRTRFLAACTLAAFSVSSLFHYLPTLPGPALGLAASGLATLGLVAALREERELFYYAVLMDGTMLLQFAIVALAA